MGNKIVKLKPNGNLITFIIHINNNCNFRCTYCVAGNDFSEDFLGLSEIENIVKIIKQYSLEIDERNILITLSGGEPTIHKDFINILQAFLSIASNKIKIQIDTNGLNLLSYDKRLGELSLMNNIDRLYFNISYHFFEYKDKEDILINTLLVLAKYNINYGIKFLLPDKNQSLKSFLKIKDYISKKIAIKEDKSTYTLITNTLGKISKTYNNEVIDYYNNIHLSDIYSDNDLNRDGNLISVELENGETQKYGLAHIYKHNLNNFKGFECKYVNKHYMNIQISAKGELFFGNCYTLSKMKYNIDNLGKLLYGGDKKVLCGENVCYCDVGILLEKKKTGKSKSIIAIENHLLKSLKKYINNISIDSIIISLDDNIQVIFKEKGIFIYFIVEKPNKSNYSLIKNGLGYWFYAKNESNINMDVKAFYSDNRNKINNLIVILSKFDSVYKKIIK